MVFGDGAAAAILTGSDFAPPGLQILSVASQLTPASTQLLGYDLRSDGFHVVLDRRLPRLIATSLGRAVRDFLEKAEMEKIDFLAAHGGGPRILDAVQKALCLEDPLMAPSRESFDQVEKRIVSLHLVHASDAYGNSGWCSWRRPRYRPRPWS